MADIHTEHAHAIRRGSDMGAAIAGFLIGAVALLIVLGGIVELTNRHYDREKPAATAQG